MFIAELNLYIDYFKEELENDIQAEQFSKRKKYYTSFYQNLCNGIAYYRNSINQIQQSGISLLKTSDMPG